ncbi:MAG: serine hydrolase domain-containing protein [Oceanicaulis sp.]
MADRRRRGSWWKIPGAIAAAFILIAGGLWVEDQFGWTDLPEEAPSAEVPSDPAYAAAGAAALERLAAMRARTGIPGATAAVSVDGELVWAGAVGWTDASTGTPVTTDTTFRIGSTSKAMTATVIARLAARDVLRLDDTVADHWPAPLNADWAQLRIDRLMSHTAGMPGYENNTDWLGLAGTLRMRKRFDSVEDGLTLVDGSRLAYAQGEDFFYSSFDTNLAARVAEAASGRDYAALLEETVTAPLGLATPYLADHGDTPAFEAGRHEMRGGRARAWGPVDVSQRWPGGGLAARSADLVVVAGAWLDEDFIPSDLAARFWTPMRLNSGAVNEQNYAIGWRSDIVTTRFGDAAPVRMVHHGGVSRGAMSWLVLYPDLGIAVAVNINAQTPQFSDFSSVEPEILRLFAEAAGRTPEAAAID